MCHAGARQSCSLPPFIRHRSRAYRIYILDVTGHSVHSIFFPRSVDVGHPRSLPPGFWIVATCIVIVSTHAAEAMSCESIVCFGLKNNSEGEKFHILRLRIHSFTHLFTFLNRPNRGTMPGHSRGGGHCTFQPGLRHTCNSTFLSTAHGGASHLKIRLKFFPGGIGFGFIIIGACKAGRRRTHPPLVIHCHL